MPEYREGPEAKEKSEQTVRTLFQVPKPTNRKEKQAEIPSLRKKPRPDKNSVPVPVSRICGESLLPV